jgi:hypothetical protein
VFVEPVKKSGRLSSADVPVGCREFSRRTTWLIVRELIVKSPAFVSGLFAFSSPAARTAGTQYLAIGGLSNPCRAFPLQRQRVTEDRLSANPYTYTYTSCNAISPYATGLAGRCDIQNTKRYFQCDSAISPLLCCSPARP